MNKKAASPKPKMVSVQGKPNYGYLGHFAKDCYLHQGHNDVPGGGDLLASHLGTYGKLGASAKQTWGDDLKIEKKKADASVAAASPKAPSLSGNPTEAVDGIDERLGMKA